MLLPPAALVNQRRPSTPEGSRHQLLLWLMLSLWLPMCTPRLPPLEIFWRVHFMLGAAAFSMSGIKALRAIAVIEERMIRLDENIARIGAAVGRLEQQDRTP